MPSLPQPFSQQHSTKRPQCQEQGWVPRKGSTSGQVQASLPVPESEESRKLPAGRRGGGLRLLFSRGTCTCLTALPGARPGAENQAEVFWPLHDAPKESTQGSHTGLHGTHTQHLHMAPTHMHSMVTILACPKDQLALGSVLHCPFNLHLYDAKEPCGDWGAHSHPQAGSPAASSDNGTWSLQLGSPAQETVPQGSARMGQTWPGQQVGREDGLEQVET